MPTTPEEKAWQTINDLLKQAAWIVENRIEANIDAGSGVAVGNLPCGGSMARRLPTVSGRCGRRGDQAKRKGSTQLM